MLSLSYTMTKLSFSPDIYHVSGLFESHIEYQFGRNMEDMVFLFIPRPAASIPG